jgi:phosphomannomutase/phosphoglucomutase
LNPHIFREYDIRGIAGTDLDAAGAETLGRAFGTLFRAERRQRIVVGHDVRLSSPEYAEALVGGLVSTGCDVLDVGLVPTPVLYFAVDTLGADGGIAVTASHNPPEFNGFKSRTRERALFGEDLQHLLRLLQRGEFAHGTGTRTRHDILDAYVERVAGDVRLARPVHAVVDCGNGAASVVAPRLLERLGCRLDLLYCEPDGRFPNHIADPTVPEHMRDLCRDVPQGGADIGIGFDGDADRVGIVDDGGRLRFGDELLILFARALLPERPGPVVFDVKCSQALVDEVRRLGGRPEMWKTGYPHIQARMRETGALLAGEMSGHMYFADRYYGYDDGIYAACRALEIVSAERRPLSARLADVPRYVSTPEIRVDSTDADKFRIVEAVAAHFRARYETIEIDGARILFPSGWALVRASNTQPVLVLRFEADSRDNLERIQAMVRTPLQAAVGAGLPF